MTGTSISNASGTAARNGVDLVVTLDPLPKGIALGKHRLRDRPNSRNFCFLRLGEEGRVMPLKSRYTMLSRAPLDELERQLARLSDQGILRQSIVYFGVTSDPFFPFEGKFDTSRRILALFERFQPGLLVLQTRSPLIVLAMPHLLALSSRLSITIGVETLREDAVSRYCPGLPRIQDRLKAATALRRLGLRVTIQTAPLLPYGNWETDAHPFAQVLAEHADAVFVRSLQEIMSSTRRCQLEAALARDRKFHWLRSDACKPLIEALETTARNKLESVVEPKASAQQMTLFPM